MSEWERDLLRVVDDLSDIALSKILELAVRQRHIAAAMSETRFPIRWRAIAGALGIAIGITLIALYSRRSRREIVDVVPLVLQPSGCHAVLSNGTCERPQRGPIRVWIDASPPVVVRLDDKEAPAAATVIDGGSRISIDVGSASRLTVVANGRTGSLALATAFVPPWAVEATEARTRGDHATARALALPHVDDPDASVRAKALGLAGRAELALGNVSEAVAHLTRSSREAESAGRVSDAVDDALAMSFALAQRSGRWTEAGAVIDRIEPLLSSYADGRARAPYYRALVDFAFGDIKAAMRRLRIARTQAERLGFSRLVWNVRNSWAIGLERWGKRSEAIAELTSLVVTNDSDIAACDRATSLLNLGWSRLMRARERSGPCVRDDGAASASAKNDVKEATQSLRAALAIGASCPEAHRDAMAHVILGDVALGDGDLETAARELASIDLHDADHDLHRDALELSARIDVARGNARGSLGKFERLAALARARGRIDDERHALEGQGIAAEKLGEWERALSKLAEADALLEASGVVVPLGEEGAYRRMREETTRSRIDLLVGHARTKEALDVARKARARLLAETTAIDRIADLPSDVMQRWLASVEQYRTERTALDAKGAHDWELSTADLAKAERERTEDLRRLRGTLDDAMSLLPRFNVDLPPLSSDTDVAVFATTLRNDAVVFVANGDSVRATRIAKATDASAAARAIKAAAEPDVDHAANVRVVTSSDLSCADVHAQRRADGKYLATSARVIYGLDLPNGRSAGNQGKRAIVVSDAHGDLPLARDEGVLVAARLGGSFEVTHLAGKDAIGISVRAALPKAAYFHYAGHAVERDGELVLPLAGSTQLTTSDVLALPVSPERVTLSACEAGRISASGLTIGLGFAQAFVERGAIEVLAPTRPVKDEVALALARALVDSKSQDFSAALAALTEAHPDSDWSAYRIWGR